MINAERFWSKVDRRGPDECWEWQAGRRPQGYGQFAREGRSVGAHRVAFELTNGPITAGLCICHSCDNPPCCNPGHLWAGTHGDNNRDKTAKGRNVRLPRDESKVRHRRGSGVAKAKLTEADVVRIRELSAEGVGPRAIAKMFGVDRTLIHYIKRGDIWKHVPLARAAIAAMPHGGG